MTCWDSTAPAHVTSAHEGVPSADPERTSTRNSCGIFPKS